MARKFEYIKLNTENGLALGVSPMTGYTVWFDKDTHKIDTEVFNELGEAGWELTTSIHSNSAFVTHWFKREVQP